MLRVQRGGCQPASDGFESRHLHPGLPPAAICAKVTADSRLAYQSTTNLVETRGSFSFSARNETLCKVPTKLAGYCCDRCEHEWLPRDKSKDPMICPKCKSPYWNTPRRQR